MSDITFAIMKIVVSLVMAILTAFVVPYVKKQLAAIQNEEVLRIITKAVEAAQQTMTGGEAKKKEVVEFMTRWLNDHKINITAEQLDKLIEAAVYEMKKGE